MNEVCGTDMPLDGDLGQHATSADPYGTADAMNELIQEDQGLRWVCILHDIMNECPLILQHHHTDTIQKHLST